MRPSCGLLLYGRRPAAGGLYVAGGTNATAIRGEARLSGRRSFAVGAVVLSVSAGASASASRAIPYRFADERCVSHGAPFLTVQTMGCGGAIRDGATCAGRRRCCSARSYCCGQSLRDLDAIVPKLRQLGARHVAYGAQPAHYPVVGSALIAAMAAVAGADWKEEYEAAWAEAFDVVAATMLEGVEDAALATAA